MMLFFQVLPLILVVIGSFISLAVILRQIQSDKVKKQETTEAIPEEKIDEFFKNNEYLQDQLVAAEIRKSIVIISSDNSQFYEEVSVKLNSFNYDTILIPKDGMKLLEYIRNILPDIVVMDVFMHNLDAISIMKTIRDDYTVPTPIFITISSFDSDVLELELTRAGAGQFFLKPVSVDVMVEKIIQLVKSKNENAAYITKTHGIIQHQPLPELEMIVAEVIRNIGIPNHHSSYRYLKDSIILVIRQPEIINSVTKQLYPTVAKKNLTTSSRVERSIRHGIEIAWDRGDVDTLNSYFGCDRGKLSNKEFIALISEKVSIAVCNKVI